MRIASGLVRLVVGRLSGGAAKTSCTTTCDAAGEVLKTLASVWWQVAKKTAITYDAAWLCLRVAILTAALCFLWLCTIPAFGQDAEISGRITDPKGLPVPKVKVVAVNVLTNISTSSETNDVGIYVIVGLKPSIYRVLVEKEGFDQVVKPNVELHVDDHAALNFELRIGSMATTVTVEAGAPIINTESAAVSTVVDRQFVENLPLNGRSFHTLLALTPGVTITKTTVNSQGQFSVNGQRANANYFMIDGVSANTAASTNDGPNQHAAGTLPGFSVAGGSSNLVSVDAVQEFRVQTSTFAPEYGRMPGGQISILTRSGTKDFHGAAFEYLRNDVLDANDWFANNRGLSKPPVRQNDFGGVFGGPIIKNRTFFFFSYEGLRLRLPFTVTAQVPSLQARQVATGALQQLMNAFPLP